MANIVVEGVTFGAGEAAATLVHCAMAGFAKGTFGECEKQYFPGDEKPLYHVTLWDGRELTAWTTPQGWHATHNGWVCDDPDLEVAAATVLTA